MFTVFRTFVLAQKLAYFRFIYKQNFYSKLHSASADLSLTKICLPLTAGCAHDELSATAYLATGS